MSACAVITRRNAITASLSALFIPAAHADNGCNGQRFFSNSGQICNNVTAPVRQMAPTNLGARDVAFNAPAYKQGDIAIDHHNHFLYLVLGNNLARRYPVVVGQERFAMRNQRWRVVDFNPNPRNAVLGAAAINIWPENPALERQIPNMPDTIFAIHGTNQPALFDKPDGQRIASLGCIRMRNEHITEIAQLVQQNSQIQVYFRQHMPQLRTYLTAAITAPTPTR